MEIRVGLAPTQPGCESGEAILFEVAQYPQPRVGRMLIQRRDAFRPALAEQRRGLGAKLLIDLLVSRAPGTRSLGIVHRLQQRGAHVISAAAQPQRGGPLD